MGWLGSPPATPASAGRSNVLRGPGDPESGCLVAIEV